MRNTGIEYSSADRKPVVLEELATLLPPLSEEQRSALEADLLTNGCYSPIIVNEDLAIVDGHNRQAICEAHNIPYRMAVFTFNSMLEAKQWMIDTQRGRRNLQPWELGQIALKLRPEVEMRARANQSAAGGDKSEGALSATLPEALSPVDTRRELAQAVGLGERTMGKVMKIDENAPAAVRAALDRGELSVNQGYNITRQLQGVPAADREREAVRAVEIAKARKELREQDSEIDRRSRIARTFCKAFEKACLLKPTEENVRFLSESTRMTPDEMDYHIHTSRALAQVFLDIADILEQRILPTDWRSQNGKEQHSSGGQG